jgi:hypothetical protein
MTDMQPFDYDVWVYYFDDPSRRALIALTLIEDGSNLPSNVAWNMAWRIMIGPCNRPFVDAMEAAIEAGGFYLHVGSRDLLNDPDVQAGIAKVIRKRASDRS